MLFTDSVSDTNNTKVDNGKSIVSVMPMCKFIKYSDSYSNTSWNYKKYDPGDNMKDAKSTTFNVDMKGKASVNGNTNTIPLSHLSNFWRTFEIPLINCKTNLILTLFPNCVVSTATGAVIMTITHKNSIFQ